MLIGLNNRHTILLVAILLSSLALSCSTITSPPPEEGASYPTEALKFVRIGSRGPGVGPGLLARPLGADMPSVSDTIKAAEGGELQMVYNNGQVNLTFTLQIPAGALSEDREIKMGLVSEEYLIVGLEPDGTRFNIPVKLSVKADSLDLSDREEESIQIYWYNPETKLWEPQKAQVDINDSLDGMDSEIELEHFSIYAWA